MERPDFSWAIEKIRSEERRPLQGLFGFRFLSGSDTMIIILDN
jgi:hypothetical protein